MGYDKEFRNEIQNLKLKVGNIKNLDNVVCRGLECVLDRKLCDAERAYVCSVLQSEDPKKIQKNRYLEENIEQWK